MKSAGKIAKKAFKFNEKKTFLLLIGLIAISFFVFVVFNKRVNIEAATFGWLQTTWSGGASTTATAAHPANQSGWSLFNSKTSNLNTANNQLQLAMLSGATRVETADADFNAGTKTNVYIGSGKVTMQKPVGATCGVATDCATNYCVGSPSLCQVPPVECDGSNGTFICGNLCTYKGDIYSTVSIGSQCWFSQNLRTIVNPNDTAITKGSQFNGTHFGDATTAYYSCPPDVASGGTDGEDCAAAGGSLNLGMLYQWKAIMNGSAAVATGKGPRGICPANWHIPTDDGTVNSDFGKLVSSVRGISGCSGNEATCLRVGGASGFNMPYAGYRMADGWYFQRSSGVRMWTASYYMSPWVIFEDMIGGTVTQSNSSDMVVSARCVHD